MPYEKNHYFPQYCLQYWKKSGAKLYDRKTKIDRKFNPSNIFHKNKFYWFDETDQYEKRLGKVEHYMSVLLKRIENETKSINLTDFEIYYIQIYSMLQSSRQLNTTEVIIDDETGFYQSNNYLFGVINIKDEKSMKIMMIEFLEILEYLLSDEQDGSKHSRLAFWVSLIHLNIIRENNLSLCVSEVSAIIENDMDGHFLYSYLPQTPRTAFLLIKSTYFFKENYMNKYQERFANNKSEPISMIISKQNINKLKCQYEKENFNENLSSSHQISVKTNIEEMKQKNNQLNYLVFENETIDEWNKIIFDGGKNIIHVQDQSYIKKLESSPEPGYRHIYFIPLYNL